MTRLSQGPVELSTIQTLCILSLLEFNNSNTHLASVYSSLALDLVLSAGLSSENSRVQQTEDYQERRRCYWSVVLLKNLYGSPSGLFSMLQDDKTPKPFESPEAPLGTSSAIRDASLEQPEGVTSDEEAKDLGIFMYAIQLSEIWRKTARWAHRRGKPGGSLPSWSSQSEYAQIMAHLMEYESKFPWKYRFRPARYSEHEPAQLEQHRDFWVTWFLLQMMYHSILCLLNHPLVMSLALRNFRMTQVPEVFLQHTAYLTTNHTHWIVHLLDLSKQKQFNLYDPALAPLVAITATIYLQQSFSEDPGVRAKKQECFRKCVSFIQDLGAFWPYSKAIAEKLEQFERVVSTSFHDSVGRSEADRRVFIDLSLFWDIIESSFTSELPRAADSYFGTSLTVHRQPLNTATFFRSQFLPEPTHINENGMASGGVGEPFAGSSAPQLSPPSNNVVPGISVVDQVDPFHEGAILAESYFAQGDDFVGSMDDWWFQGRSI
ncbi:hypothetical protein LTS17_009157 [Exophiala oligosperma]